MRVLIATFLTIVAIITGTNSTHHHTPKPPAWTQQDCTDFCSGQDSTGSQNCPCGTGNIVVPSAVYPLWTGQFCQNVCIENCMNTKKTYQQNLPFCRNNSMLTCCMTQAEWSGQHGCDFFDCNSCWAGGDGVNQGGKSMQGLSGIL